MRLLSFMLLPLLMVAAPTPAAGDRSGGRDRGPGLAAERQGDVATYRVGGFDRVAIGGPGTADVRVGPAWSLRISGPAQALDNLRVVVERGRLEIGPRWSDRASTEADRRVRIQLTLPRLADVALGGSGRVTVDRVTGERFAAALGGSGTLTLGKLAVGQATFSVGGSGEIAAAGTARVLEINLGGSGSVAAAGLRAATATVSAAGSGDVRATVDGTATVSLVGSGDVDLGTQARCRVTRMGSGRVRCGG